MRLPDKIKSKVKSPPCREAGQKSKVILGIVIFLVFLFFPQSVNATFVGGINIADHYSEFDQAAQASGGNGWVYVMMTPSNASLINQWLTTYPNIKLIIRGHVPDSGGNTLTSEYANAWAEALSNVSKSVYFMPVNEPNNPYESMSGIPASIVVNYISALKNALTAKNILGSKVILLSPTIDIYTLSDNGPGYINDLGGWSFFEQFSGIALNLYGQFKDGVLDPDAPLIKKGQGYEEFLQSHFGATPSQAAGANIYAVETGVLKVGDPRVKYKENSAEIVSYLNTVKPIWGKDPNFKMFSIFSYDPGPGGDRNPWIYNDSNVLASMDLKNISIVTPTIQPAEDFGEQVDVFTQANRKLLPKSIQDLNKEKESNCTGGIMVFSFCIGGSNPAKLANQTGKFQPMSVPPQKKVVDSTSCKNPADCAAKLVANLFNVAINPQLNELETGSLNAYRPGKLQFSQIADSGNKYIAQNSQETKVLGTADSPELTEKKSFAFTMKMILPAVFGKNITVPTSPPSGPQETPTPGGPTATPIPGQPSPPVYTCNVITDEDNYCSVVNLSKFFLSDQLAREASMICLKETGGNNPLISNKSCIETDDGTDDSINRTNYSIGLFQINLFVYHPEAITYKAGDNPPCTIIDQEKLTEWENFYKNPDNNIRKAVDLRTSWGNWCAWRTASRMCGIDQCL